jgi:hypothetical protein
MLYKPVDIKFVALGGQSKIFSFHSETLDRDFVLKLYDSKYSLQAEQEYNAMQMLNHEGILKVYQLGTIKSIS